MAMVQGHANCSASFEEIAVLQRNGFTPEQCRRLIALRERVRQGGGREDLMGSATGDPAFDRRLAFARWLVEHGKLDEFGGSGHAYSDVGIH